MRDGIRARLSYGNVIATIALFVALGGVAVAAGLPRNSVGPKQIKPGAVGTPKLQNGAVSAAKLGNGAVGSTKLAGNVPALPNELGRWETERGMFEIGGATTFVRDNIGYPIMLPSEVEKRILEVGQSSPECPGRNFDAKFQLVPTASPGHLCLYIALRGGKSPSLGFTNGGSPFGQGSRPASAKPIPTTGSSASGR